MLARSSDRLDEVVPLLAALLGVPTGERYPALEPHPAGAKAADAAKRWSTSSRVSRRGSPVLALYEDVHWIDPSTLELLEHW